MLADDFHCLCRFAEVDIEMIDEVLQVEAAAADKRFLIGAVIHIVEVLFQIIDCLDDRFGDIVATIIG